MRARLFAAAALVFAGLSSCDGVTSPVQSTEKSRPSALFNERPCDVNWVDPVDGEWEDGTKWDNGYSPSSYEVACISAPGSYTVTIKRGEAWHAYIGGDAATPTVFIEADSLTPLVTKQLDVRALVVKSGTVVMVPGASVRLGTLEILPTALFQISGTNVIHDIDLSGGMLFTGGPTTVDSVDDVTFDGTVVIGRTYSLTLNVVGTWGVTMKGGVITGDDGLYINSRTSPAPDFDWYDGTLGTQLSDPTQPIVMLRGMALWMSALSKQYGMIDVDSDGDPISVGGSISPNSRVRVRRAQWAPVAPIDMERLTNNGHLEFTTSLTEALRLTGGVVNRGTMIVGSGRADFELDSLLNVGTIVVKDSMRLTKGFLRNAGSVQISSAGDLVVSGPGDYLAEGSGAVQGTLFVESGGRAGGDGTINRVVSIGGTVNAGGAGTRVGNLTINTLLLDSASRVIIDVGGTTPGTFDRLHVANNLTLDGTLDLRAVPPFTAGVCGQVLRPITLGRTGIRTGSFDTTVGTHVAPGRRWRVNTTVSSIELIGFDPSYALSLAPGSIASTEGGPSSPVELCLAGTFGPASTVTVDVASRLGQSSVSPSQLTFNSANWMYPQRINALAIDDAVAEPPTVDSIRLRLTSADPAYSGVARTQIAHTITDNDAGADLTVAHSGGPVVVNLNQQFEGLFRVSNTGTAASTGSIVVITPMAGLTYVSSSPTVPCTPGIGVVTCTVGAVAAGGSTDFTILFRASASGVHDNTATVTGNEYDPVPGNDASSWTVTVN